MKTPTFSDFNNRSIKIAILGELMCERGAVNSVINGDPFKYISPFLQSHDYVVGQLETTLSGLTSNYPRFSSGDYFAEYLSHQVDFLFTANNHSFDWGVDGVYHTIDTLKQYGISQIGVHKKNKKPHYKGVNVRDFSLSFLNYTQFINHGTKKNPQHQDDVFQESADSADARGVISFYEESSVKKEINLAKKGCDVILAAIHLANQRRNGSVRELSRKSTSEQRGILEKMCASGADIVLGGHPHYFQGGRQQGKQLMVWSLGSFFTLMEHPDYENNSGCVLSVRYDSYLNPTYTFLPVATVYNTQDHFYYVLPIAPLAQGFYSFVSEQKRYALLQELSQIRETLRENSLVEEIIPISLI
jgi:poly-gamma-glutamate capsule biosynthesis protein CapA/YwtB (metallophosphatase superfamily)